MRENAPSNLFITPAAHNKNPLLTVNERYIMWGMTLIYLIIALINLGSMKAPQTGWTPSKPDDSFTVAFDRPVDLDRITLYAGRGLGWDVWGIMDVEYYNNGSFEPLTSIRKDSVFVWYFRNVDVKTTALRFTARMYDKVDCYQAEYMEIGIYEKGSKTPVKSFEISDRSNTDVMAGKLFDEQSVAVYSPSYKNGTYFDELYFARTAYEQIHGIDIYETTHPPLGKSIIALGILVFGMNPFGWRIAGTLVGAAMIPLMYCFGKKVFKDPFFAFISAFLMMFDFMHFVQTRISTIDSYCTFFVILMFYFMFDYYAVNSYDVGYPRSLKPLILSGIFFGLGAASKWIALYGGAGLAILFFASRVREYVRYRELKISNPLNIKRIPWLKVFVKDHIIKTCLWCVLFFVIIPAIIYSLSYLPIIDFSDQTGYFKEVWDWQTHMYNYHSHLDADHSFKSSWWEWPLMVRPIWYYSGSDLSPDMGSSISSFGNPAIWWAGIYAFLTVIVIFFSETGRRAKIVLSFLFGLIIAGFIFKFISLPIGILVIGAIITALALISRNLAIAVPVVATLAQYLPWAAAPRKLTFIYHFFACIPFIILLIVYVIKQVIGSHPKDRWAAYIYLAAVLFLFIAFYPVLSGLVVPRDYLKAMQWFKSWYW